MTKALHTPGPWAVDENDHWLITADCDGLVVAEIPYGEGNGGDRHHEVNDANARLIAAAPALLDRLEKTTAFMAKADKSFFKVFIDDNQVVLDAATKGNNA